GLIQTPGHGTRTGSVLCAPTSAKFAGAAPGVPVVPYRVVEDTVLEPIPFNRKLWLDPAAALRHAVDNGCRIVSISLGGPSGAKEFGAVVDDAYEKGVLIIAAAGQEYDKVVYPAKYERVTGVGGIKLSEGRYRLYNKYDDPGGRVDIWA